MRVLHVDVLLSRHRLSKTPPPLRGVTFVPCPGGATAFHGSGRLRRPASTFAGRCAVWAATPSVPGRRGLRDRAGGPGPSASERAAASVCRPPHDSPLEFCLTSH